MWSVSRMSRIAERAETGKEGQAAEIKKKKKAVLIYLTAKISSDRFSSDLMLKQMDHSNA